MTNREAQIFQWIMENPMISQEELAAKAGIARSSAAVHISNLMKKGYILGKGYVTNKIFLFFIITPNNNTVNVLEIYNMLKCFKFL